MATTFAVRALCTGGLILLAAGISIARAQTATNDFDARAREIVSEMTLQEKIAELHGIHDSSINDMFPRFRDWASPDFALPTDQRGSARVMNIINCQPPHCRRLFYWPQPGTRVFPRNTA